MTNSTKTLNECIGERIAELRRKHKLTQDQLAEELDVTVKHISSVERGVASLSLERLVDASKVLDCTMDYMILGTNQDEAMRKIPPSLISILNSDDEGEIELLQEYLNFFIKMRSAK